MKNRKTGTYSSAYTIPVQCSLYWRPLLFEVLTIREPENTVKPRIMKEKYNFSLILAYMVSFDIRRSLCSGTYPRSPPSPANGKGIL